MPEEPRLTGKELVAKTKRLKHLNVSEIARQCGYYKRTSQGQIRVELKKYHEAIMIATGLKASPNQDNKAKATSTLVSTKKNGNIVIGVAHTKRYNFPEGTEWDVKVTNKKITLIKVDTH